MNRAKSNETKEAVVATQWYSQQDLKRAEEIVKELHGLKGYDAWAEHIAKALRQAKEAGIDKALTVSD